MEEKEKYQTNLMIFLLILVIVLGIFAGVLVFIPAMLQNSCKPLNLTNGSEILYHEFDSLMYQTQVFYEFCLYNTTIDPAHNSIWCKTQYDSIVEYGRYVKNGSLLNYIVYNK